MNNLQRCLRVEFPDDVGILLLRVATITQLSPKEVELLCETFCEEVYAAHWMLLDDKIIEGFGQWLGAEFDGIRGFHLSP